MYENEQKKKSCLMYYNNILLHTYSIFNDQF